MDYLKNALNKYAVFSGRTSRKEYWMFYLWYVIVYSATYLISWMLDKFVIGNALGFERPATMIIPMAFALYFFVPSISIMVRRLHDTNRSGWWWLLSFIPVLGSIWVIILLLLKGTVGDNLYGPSTTGVTAEAPAATAITNTKVEETKTEEVKVEETKAEETKSEEAPKAE